MEEEEGKGGENEGKRSGEREEKEGKRRGK